MGVNSAVKEDEAGELDRAGDLVGGRVSCPWQQAKASLGGCLGELGPFTLVLEAQTGQGIDTTHTAQAFYDPLNEAGRQQLSRVWGWGSCVKCFDSWLWSTFCLFGHLSKFFTPLEPQILIYKMR